tara:strand:- start:352 stop:600 length:249 start_codon:yes stop_codon:yes gene_type:complete
MLYPGRRQLEIERLFEIPPVSLEMSPTETEILPEQTKITYKLDITATFHNMAIDTTILDPMSLQFETDHHLPNLTTTIKKIR